jgi:hypothetical protein
MSRLTPTSRSTCRGGGGGGRRSPRSSSSRCSQGTADKDLVRNVELYVEVPSIKQYWVLDPRPDPDRPSLRVYRRRGKNWQKPIDVAFGETYQTPRVLPGFALVVDPDL